MRQVLWGTVAVVVLLTAFLPVTLAAEDQNQPTVSYNGLTAAQSATLKQLQAQMQANWHPMTVTQIAQQQTSSQPQRTTSSPQGDQYAKLTRAILNLHERLSALENKENEKKAGDSADLKAELDAIKASVDKLQQDLQKTNQDLAKLQKQMKPTNILYGF